MAKRKVTLSIESQTYSDFKKYCEDNAVMLSKKVEIFMDNFMKHSKGKRMTYFIFAIFVSIFIAELASAYVTVIQLNTTAANDSYIYQGSANTNYGSSKILEADSELTKNERILLYFDLGSILVNSTVHNAKLELYLSDATGIDFNLSAYRITRAWNEAEVTWNRYNTTDSWTNPGGDYAATEYDKILINLTYGWKSWDVTNLIREFVNGSSQNYGIILVPSSGSGNNYKQFISSDNTTSLSLTPKLTVNYTSDAVPPSITISYPANKTYNSKNGLPLSYSVSDNVAISSCWYSFDGGPNGTLAGCANSTFSVSSDGSHNIRVYANDTSNNVNSSIRYFSVDSTAPQWSNIQNSTPSVYSSSALALFNVTWSDAGSGIGSVLLESNFSGTSKNYSMYLISGNVYGFNASIPAGTFYWKSYANDSVGNLNVSSTNAFTVSKAGNPVSLYINNNLNQNDTIIYGTSSNATGFVSAGNVNLFREDVSVSNPEIKTLSAKLSGYKYTVNTTGNENYTANSTSYYLIVDKAVPTLSLLLDGVDSDKTVYAGSTVNISARLSIFASGSLNLTENSVLINSGTSPVENLTVYNSAGTFVIGADYSGDENYSSASINHTLSVTAYSGGSSSGGGGHSRRSIVNNTNSSEEKKFEFGVPEISIEPLQSLVTNPGENRRIPFSVKNSGTAYLNECKLAGVGNYSWLVFEGVKDLSIGQMSEFLATLSVPVDVLPGGYDVPFSIVCKETVKDSILHIEIVKKKLTVELVETKIDKEKNLMITYALNELAGEEQSVDIEIVLLDLKGERVAEAIMQKSLEPYSKTSFETTLEVAESIKGGNFNLLINANSGIASAFVQDYVIFDKRLISGQAFSLGENGGNIAIAIIILSFLVFAFFIARRIARFSEINKRKKIISAIAGGIKH